VHSFLLRGTYKFKNNPIINWVEYVFRKAFVIEEFSLIVVQQWHRLKCRMHICIGSVFIHRCICKFSQHMVKISPLKSCCSVVVDLSFSCHDIDLTFITHCAFSSKSATCLSGASSEADKILCWQLWWKRWWIKSIDWRNHDSLCWSSMSGVCYSVSFSLLYAITVTKNSLPAHILSLLYFFTLLLSQMIDFCCCSVALCMTVYRMAV